MFSVLASYLEYNATKRPAAIRPYIRRIYDQRFVYRNFGVKGRQQVHQRAESPPMDASRDYCSRLLPTAVKYVLNTAEDDGSPCTRENHSICLTCNTSGKSTRPHPSGFKRFLGGGKEAREQLGPTFLLVTLVVVVSSRRC